MVLRHLLYLQVINSQKEISVPDQEPSFKAYGESVLRDENGGNPKGPKITRGWG